MGITYFVLKNSLDRRWILMRRASITRTERYAGMVSGFLVYIFAATFVLDIDCAMVPAPPACMPGTFLTACTPSTFTCIISIVGSPLAFILRRFFGWLITKRPRPQTLTPKEKSSTIETWRSWQIMAWGLLIALLLCVVFSVPVRCLYCM